MKKSFSFLVLFLVLSAPLARAAQGIKDLSLLGTSHLLSTGTFIIDSGATFTVSGAFGGTPTGGTLNLSNVTLTLGAQSGASLTNLNASNLGSGTVPAARMPAFTGDITTSAGAVATTLATVNSNVGTYGSATQAAQITVNAKGLITAASGVTVTPAVGSITGLGTGVSTALGATPNASGGVVTYGGNIGAATGTSLSLSGNVTVSGGAAIGSGASLGLYAAVVYQATAGNNAFKAHHVNGNGILLNPSYNYYDAYNHIFRSLNGSSTLFTIDNLGNLTVSGVTGSSTANAWPGSLVATGWRAYSATTSGLVLAGYGSTYDVAIVNRDGTNAITVAAGTSNVSVGGNLTIAGTSAIKGVRTATATFDFGTIASGDASSVCSVSMPGVSATASSVIVNAIDGDNFPQFCTLNATPAGDAVNVRLYNPTAASKTIGSRTIRITVINF